MDRSGSEGGLDPRVVFDLRPGSELRASIPASSIVKEFAALFRGWRCIGLPAAGYPRFQAAIMGRCLAMEGASADHGELWQIRARQLDGWPCAALSRASAQIPKSCAFLARDAARPRRLSISAWLR